MSFQLEQSWPILIFLCLSLLTYMQWHFSLLAEAQLLSWDDVKGFGGCMQLCSVAEENELRPSSSTVERSCGRKVSHERNSKPVAEPHKIKHNYKKCMKSKLCAPVVYEIQDISVLGPVMIHTRPPSFRRREGRLGKMKRILSPVSSWALIEFYRFDEINLKSIYKCGANKSLKCLPDYRGWCLFQAELGT